MSKPTLSGINERVALEDLNIGQNDAAIASVAKKKGGVLSTLTLFLAGMYTGIGCAGTPHDGSKTDSAGRDNRPI